MRKRSVLRGGGCGRGGQRRRQQPELSRRLPIRDRSFSSRHGRTNGFVFQLRLQHRSVRSGSGGAFHGAGQYRLAGDCKLEQRGTSGQQCGRSANGTLTAAAIYCGLGNPSDFPAGVSGKIAHIRRGTLTFEDKVNNAIAAGATGVIISDDVAGESLEATLSENTSIVVVAVSKENGDDLQSNDGVTATIVNQNPASYDIYDGTSMATPHVSGVAALLFGARHGQITPAQVQSAMEASAFDLGTPGWDEYYGYGLVDAKAALGQVIPVEESATASPTSVGPGGTVTVTVNLSTSSGLTTITANGVSLSGTGTTYSGAITANSAAGTYPIDINVSDQWGNSHDDTSLSYTTTSTNSVPGISIGSPSVSSTASGPVTYTVTYANATAVTLSAGDITLNATGTASGVVSVSGSDTLTRTVTISNITGNGALGISIAAGTATDSAGSAPAAGPSATFAVTNLVPGISISAPSVSSTSSGPVTYTITYTNATAVTLTAASVSLNLTGTASGAVSVSGTGTTNQTVTISGVTGTGTIGISIAAGTAVNSAGSAPAAGPSATFTVTNSVPGISIGSPSVSSTSSGPVSYTINYTSATAITLSTGNVTLNATGTATGTVSVSGSGVVVRTVTISSISGSGTLGISIAAGTASNSIGSAPAAGPSATFIVRSQPPVVTISSPVSGITRNCPDMSISGTATSGNGIAGIAWEVTDSGGNTTSGTCTGTNNWTASGLTLSLGMNTITVIATDTAGNTGTANAIVTYDDEQPGSAWQGTAMVCLPIVPDDTDPQQEVGFSGSLWFEYDTTSGNYLSYPDSQTWFTTPSATPGRGFWAVFPAGWQSTVCGTIPDQNQAQTIHLYPGWNLIGQPFVKSVTWDISAITVQVSGSAAVPLEDFSGAIDDYAWGWNPVNGSYYLVMDSRYSSGETNSLAPWQAYWVRAYEECDLIIPAP